jgi:cell fate regulator YaaT (PSP1 superfamily)
VNYLRHKLGGIRFCVHKLTHNQILKNRSERQVSFVSNLTYMTMEALPLPLLKIKRMLSDQRPDKFSISHSITYQIISLINEGFIQHLLPVECYSIKISLIKREFCVSFISKEKLAKSESPYQCLV